MRGTPKKIESSCLRPLSLRRRASSNRTRQSSELSVASTAENISRYCSGVMFGRKK
jgi:hypothetical protein